MGTGGERRVEEGESEKRISQGGMGAAAMRTRLQPGMSDIALTARFMVASGRMRILQASKLLQITESKD